MPRRPWTSDSEGYEHLRIPIHTQPINEPECVIYALWMVANYVGNEFPDKNIRDLTKTPSIDDIREHITVDEAGWRPNQSDLTALSNEVSTTHFNLEKWPGEPPQTLCKLASESLENDVPIIAFIDAQQLHRGIRGTGPLHAIVIAGVENRVVQIGDPWVAAVQTVPRDNLEDAWDPMLHQIINVTVGPTPTSD